MLTSFAGRPIEKSGKPTPDSVSVERMMQPEEPESWRVVLLTDMALIVNFYKTFLPTRVHQWA